MRLVGSSSVFTDRREAGRRLAKELLGVLGGPPAGPMVVLGLPRGGVPVAAEVARVLGAPLDVVVVRKLGVPWQPELAMGAVGEDGTLVVNQLVLERAGVREGMLAEVEARERATLELTLRRLREGRPAVPVAGATAVVVDDGIATGASAAAACRVVRARGAARVVLAVPTAPPGWRRRFEGVADDLVSVLEPQPFESVSGAYRDFAQVEDDEVVELLRPVP